MRTYYFAHNFFFTHAHIFLRTTFFTRATFFVRTHKIFFFCALHFFYARSFFSFSRLLIRGTILDVNIYNLVWILDTGILTSHKQALGGNLK